MSILFQRGGLGAASFSLLAFAALLPAEATAQEGTAVPGPREAATPVPEKNALAEPATEVRFTAWNLRNYLHTTSPPAPGSTDRPKPQKDQQAIIATLMEIRPDILGVCEMGSPADLAHLQTALKNAGLDLPHSEHVEGDDPVRHLALLSRFPISSRQPVTHFRYLLDENQFAVQRGFLDVTVAVNPGYSLRLVGAHLKSRRDVPEADQALMRRNEAHLLRQHTDSILTAAPDTNLLVYGDFNDTRDQPGVKAIKGLRSTPLSLTEIQAEDASGERWTYYYPEADEYSRIDFLLASPQLLPEVRESASFLPGGKDWIQASDHRPVTTVLRADDAPPGPPARSRSKKSAVPEASTTP